jgi:hypothetical protein
MAVILSRRLGLLAATAAVAMTASAASAIAVLYNGTTYNSGYAIVIDFTGVQFRGSTGTLTMTFSGTSLNDYDFNYFLLNTFSDPSTNLSEFGFDVTGGMLDLSTTTPPGTYGNIGSGSISDGSSVDFCVTGGQIVPTGQ